MKKGTSTVPRYSNNSIFISNNITIAEVNFEKLIWIKYF